jgi:hypothetical protein
MRNSGGVVKLIGFKNEVIGVSAELAIADEFGVRVNEKYRRRGDAKVVAAIRPVVRRAFDEDALPAPVEHIAEGQNPVDFKCKNNTTLSVKSNQRALGKVSPQRVGQASSATYWGYFAKLADGKIPADYAGRAAMFKRITLSRTADVMRIYWENMFDCDYLLHFYEIVAGDGSLRRAPRHIVFRKTDTPEWEQDGFEFTQSLATWNESNSVRYFNEPIGEFQVHTRRDSFKFRFNMNGLRNLIENFVI